MENEFLEWKIFSHFSLLQCHSASARLHHQGPWSEQVWQEVHHFSRGKSTCSWGNVHHESPHNAYYMTRMETVCNPMSLYDINKLINYMCKLQPTRNRIWVDTWKYVGLFGSIFHALQCVSITYPQQNLCCISIATKKHQSKSYETLVLPLSSYGCRKCMFVDSLIEYIGPPNCGHYWGWSS